MCPKLTQAEGFILGVGAKMFTIAGPVIAYGVSANFNWRMWTSAPTICNMNVCRGRCLHRPARKRLDRVGQAV
ncbi:MAG: SpoVA/SpoVAEb family sporulation membrane protein [Ruminococcaceae bacterium]|nr:SpoVA/SpoVAEb family sporulation membrane protein [Oscillospiraceae bacterium]